MSKNDPTNWRRRLKGEAVALVLNSLPEYGFYRIPTKQGFKAVACWYDDSGTLHFKVDDELIAAPDKRWDLWTVASEHPIEHATYRDVRAGKPWPDLPTTPLSNMAPDDDSLEGIRDAIDAIMAEVKQSLEGGQVQSEAAANKVSNLANRLSDLSKRAETARVAEKEPHLRAGREIDDKWKPVIEKAGVYKRLKSLCESYLFRKREEKAREEAEARARAEKAAREAQEAADAAAAAAAEADNEEAEALAAKAADEAREKEAAAAIARTEADAVAARTVTAGTHGRGVHLRTVTELEIEDRDAMLAHFKDREEITEVLMKLARASHKAGIAVPGLKVNKVSKAA